MVVTRMEARIEQLERVMNETQGMRNLVADLQRDGQENREQMAAMQNALTQMREQGNTILRLLQEANHQNGGERRMEGERQEGGGGVGDYDRDGQRFRRLDMPLFDGDDPMGWTFRMERYFTVNGIPEAERLDAAVVSLEG